MGRNRAMRACRADRADASRRSRRLGRGRVGFCSSICPATSRPLYEPSKRRLTWPNGAIATMYSAEEGERLRGPQHDGLWADELGAWKGAQNVWDMAMFGLRLGKRPRAIVTTTPRPIPLLKALLKREGQDVVVTRGRTQDNAENLRRAPDADRLTLRGHAPRQAGTRR